MYMNGKMFFKIQDNVKVVNQNYKNFIEHNQKTPNFKGANFLSRVKIRDIVIMHGL